MAEKIVYKQIVHTWMYQGMDLEKVMQSLQKVGADGMDVTMRPDSNTAPEALMEWDVQAKLKSYGLTAPCGTISCAAPRDFSTNDPKLAASVVEFSKRCVDAAAHIGCDRLLVVPSGIYYGPQYNVNRQEDWARAVENIRAVAEYAQQYNQMILLEPVNRYGVILVHTIGEALQMIKDIGLPNVHVVPDTFHMHFEEEKGMVRSIHEGGSHIKCLHIGDNTRRAAGHGTMNWHAIIGALHDIDFDGPLSFEPVYNGFGETPFAVSNEAFAVFEDELQQGIAYLDMVMEDLSHDPQTLYAGG